MSFFNGICSYKYDRTKILLIDFTRCSGLIYFKMV